MRRQRGASPRKKKPPLKVRDATPLGRIVSFIYRMTVSPTPSPDDTSRHGL
jgi:hypothetical protein